MIKAVIFDMYETLITHYKSPLYFGKHIAVDMDIPEVKVREIWDTTDDTRTIGKMTLEEVFEKLKKKGYKIGLISNCYFEEAAVIKDSVLWHYFDVVCLSCEQGVAKPEEKIFDRCIEQLDVTYEECLYVGDGGSYELETAKKLGMKPVQAVWYLQQGSKQPTWRKPEFWQAESPLEIMKYLAK